MLHLLRARLAFGLLGASLAFAACDDSPSGPEAPACGNGIIEFYEECDDGNMDPNDGCHQCRVWSPATGTPFTLGATNAWTWYPVDDAICRDGSPSGLSISVGADPTKVLFFFEGGGACFEGFNCNANPFNVTEGRRFPGEAGIFERNNDRNPYKDWTWVYLPYCTGDVFAGRTRNVEIKGVKGTQQFVGDFNMRLFLDRLVPTLTDVEHVSVSGISAGGMSAVVNAKRIAREFPAARVTVLDDGGPPLSTNVVPICLQSWWNELWELDKTALADCGAACPDEGDLLFPVTKDLVSSNENLDFGLFSFREDATVRLLFSFGLRNCRMLPVPLMSAQTLATGLAEFRDTMTTLSPRVATYYAPGAGHVCITGGCFYSMEVDGVGLPEWTAKLLRREFQQVGE